MKTLIGSLKIIAAAATLIFAPCSYEEADHCPPAAPRGVYSITGDEEVMLTWYENTEPDLAGYRVYRGMYSEGPYYLIGETDLDYFLDYGLENGQTYFYAVAAFDENNNESDLSYENVFDTPRPEGYDVEIFDYREYPDFAGIDFSAYAIIPYNHPYCDIYFGSDPTNASYYIYTRRVPGQIQDYGYTESLDDVTYAPEYGWSPSGIVEAIVGHTYIIWTWDNHFAKIRITAIGYDSMIYDWAYQVDPGNPELVIRK